MDAGTAPAAERLHVAISTTFEGFFSVVEGASFERRAGHARLLLPSVPLHLFNGVVVESEECSGIADSIREVEALGLPCGVQVRVGRHPDVELKAAALGLTSLTSLPGMAATARELREARAPNLEIVRANDEGTLLAAADVARSGFGMPVHLTRPLYAPGLLGLEGFDVYVGFAEGEPVTTAMGYRTGREVAIFSVATAPAHRRRGYGAAITAHAARRAFEHGADLAWLQTSELGESVYEGLGFRHVEMHVMLRRPSSPA
jgi:ribosomal protein S18 acetylase RimI-like enzyme